MNKVVFKEFTDTSHFREVFRNDLSLWLSAPERPWMKLNGRTVEAPVSSGELPRHYYENIIQDFQWLDIAGIDNDRAFQIPLSDVYVRLRVMLDEDSPAGNGDEFQESEPINIQTALERYQRLVIVGDPGSGKSTFLKFIALMIARSTLDGNPALAIETLNLEPPLPIPVFISCWDLSDFIRRKRQEATISVLTDFIAERFTAMDSAITTEALEQMLTEGSCCLLFDGLDEVPTEQGRALVSRLVETCVAKYSKNRYIVTSRVRAYTGDTILRGEFTRCDIQEFNREDRSEFLRNWFALLFQVPREQVTSPGSESFRAFDSLLTAIERNDRIRALAVNPLLLTVIAIVHWNRRRLPEQRVDLYDECVDVLLGQRKEAERALRSKSADALDEKKEEKTYDDRTWVRKRFSEIALQIMRGDDEEITKQRVIEILRPRFFDRGARNIEEADAQAERFLDRQELRSGLLVSRRSNSYRLVHLTFQEYLTAWNLATQEPTEVKEIIGPYLQEPKWFETLQLLGGEWAKRSDEILDNYVAYLLECQGTTITERAPIIALCANILNDTSGVAEVKPTTRKNYNQALRGTLRAFDRYSGVPAKTQLEILEALGQLGAAVKDHLISATQSAHFAVRSRAIEMLVPHLPDDDLFNMLYILHDRSQETIKTYLSSLLDRDAARTRRMLAAEKQLGEKAGNAIAMLFPRFVERLQPEEGITFASNLFVKMADYSWQYGPRSNLLHRVAWHYRQYEQAWALIAQLAREDKLGNSCSTALQLLATERKNDPATLALITERAREAKHYFVRSTALQLLATKYKGNAATWGLVAQRASRDEDYNVRRTALELLAKERKDEPTTWELIAQRACEDDHYNVRHTALRLLAKERKDEPTTWELIAQRASSDEDHNVRHTALELLAKERKDEPTTWELIAQRACEDKDEYIRSTALKLLVLHYELDERTQVILTRDFWSLTDARFLFEQPSYTYIDPFKPINKNWIKRCAAKLNVTADEVLEMFQKLVDILPLKLDVYD